MSRSKLSLITYQIWIHFHCFVPIIFRVKMVKLTLGTWLTLPEQLSFSALRPQKAEPASHKAVFPHLHWPWKSCINLLVSSSDWYLHFFLIQYLSDSTKITKDTESAIKSLQTNLASLCSNKDVSAWEPAVGQTNQSIALKNISFLLSVLHTHRVGRQLFRGLKELSITFDAWLTFIKPKGLRFPSISFRMLKMPRPTTGLSF